MNGCAVLSLLIALLVLFVCCFSLSEKCTSIDKKVRGMCPFYNQTSPPDDHLKHINKDTVILHFAPLFYTGCSPLSRIFVCSTLFPFCSSRHSVVLLPCRHVCFSVYADCLHVFTSHHQQWPDFLNCSLFPSPPRLCLQPSSFINSSSSSLLSTPTASSSSPASSTSPLPSNSTSRLSTPSTSSSSTASFTDSFYFVTVVPLILVILVFGFLFLCFIFRFHPPPQREPTNTETFTLPPLATLPSPAPTTSPPDVPPPPPPQLPLHHTDFPTYANTGTLYAIAKLY